jgi:uncharacterized protein (DUF2252 family)
VNVLTSTANYEKWKASHIPLIKKDIAIKHQEMTASLFSFFRATFYRWLQLWEKECANENKAPKLLAVGDLHVENFGTWRDFEGRLIWGVNDFDEAYPMPYTVDLVRLATSALPRRRRRAPHAKNHARPAMRFSKATSKDSSSAAALLSSPSTISG